MILIVHNDLQIKPKKKPLGTMGYDDYDDDEDDDLEEELERKVNDVEFIFYFKIKLI